MNVINTSRDVVIIGGGPAGMAAAIGAKEGGAESVLILERSESLGGILNQCVHNGFGLHAFGEELTGPEYAERYVEMVGSVGIEYMLGTMVLEISPGRLITAVNSTSGLIQVKAGAVVLAMGCRERPRGAINIPGVRCAGIYTAGTAQLLVNMHGIVPGKEIVILGSGDIGLIMARRMTLEGATVRAVVELMPYSSGLRRNVVQCLDDFGIPLLLSHTVTEIIGHGRVEAVAVSKVDGNQKTIPDTREIIRCDTLLLSVGLIPENELSRHASVEISTVTGGPLVNNRLETSVEGVFACGNVLHVHDLVDNVSAEGYAAGRGASDYARGERSGGSVHALTAGKGVRYIVPSNLIVDSNDDFILIRFRVNNVYRDAVVSVYLDGERLSSSRRNILSPGEMEELRIPADWINQRPGLKEIAVSIDN